jgi:Transposase DDE domain group 1
VVACGCEDADDLDHLHTDPGFRLACGRLPDSGSDLRSQPTVSRWENAPTLREVVRMTYAMIDTYSASYKRPLWRIVAAVLCLTMRKLRRYYGVGQMVIPNWGSRQTFPQPD